MNTYKVTIRLQIEWEEAVEAETPEVAMELARIAARYHGTVTDTEILFEIPTRETPAA